MTDYQQIVDEIRFALQSEDCELTEDLRAAGREYSFACREVNQQLRKIISYLDGGLRSEAIQLSEGPPNIIDVVGILNFPELDQWADVVAIYDLPRPEPLMLGVVEQLNDAFVVDQPLQKLMARHRRLALIRAPLRLRLAVLRELMQADPETPCWEEDVRTFERARFSEMATTARTAQLRGDVAMLEELQADFAQEAWTEKPPAKVMSAVRAALTEMSRKSARQEIEEISVEMEAAFTELDLSRARELRTRWIDAKKRAGLPATDPLNEQVAPILGWVQDEDARAAAERKYTQTISQLESALGSETGLDELDRLVHEIKRLDRQLPDLIATRYRNRREALLLAQTRQHRLQLGSAFAVLLVVVGFVGFLIHRQLRASDVERFAIHTSKLLDNRQYSEARKALEGRKDIAQWDSLTALQTRLEIEEREDQSRNKRVQLELENARSAPTYADALFALERVKPMLLSTDEESAFNLIQADRQMRHTRELTERENKIRDGIQSATQALLEIDRALEDDPGDERQEAALKEVFIILAKLQTEVDGLRPEFASQLKLLFSRQKELQALRDSRLTKLKYEKELTHAALISSDHKNSAQAVSEYRKALLQYTEALGDERGADSLRKCADEDVFWRAALDWGALSGHWKEVWPNDVESIQERLRISDAYLKNFAGAPDFKSASTYAKQLKAMLAREPSADESTPGIRQRLNRIFSNPLIANSWCLQKKNVGTFYLPEAFKIPNGKLFNFPYFVGYAKTDVEMQKGNKEDDFMAHEAAPSPSSQIAASAIQRLDSLKPEAWNEFCRELSLQILNEEDLDPFLKMDLLKRSLEAAAEGDVFLEEQLSPHLKLLQGASINPLARWMNPKDEEGAKGREEASLVLARFRVLPSFDEAWKLADASRAESADRLRSPAVMVGWLKQDEGKWTCQTEWVPTGNHDLRVVFVNSGTKSSEWRTIGDASDAEFLIKPGTIPFLMQGRPVFAVRRIEQKVADR